MKKLLFSENSKLFGYQENNFLYTQNGYPVGRIVKKKIYGSDGVYIGEINMLNELVCKSKNSNLEITLFELPNLNQRLNKFEKMSGITKAIGVILKETPGITHANLEFPNFEFFEN